MNHAEPSKIILPLYQVYRIQWNFHAKPDWESHLRSITPEKMLSTLRDHPFDVLSAVFIYETRGGAAKGTTYCTERFFRIRKAKDTFDVWDGICRTATCEEEETETWETRESFSVGNLKQLARVVHSAFVRDVC